jgi:hypothetical protein
MYRECHGAVAECSCSPCALPAGKNAFVVNAVTDIAHEKGPQLSMMLPIMHQDREINHINHTHRF